jgi:large subunit ribosomal protein L15
MNPTSFPRLTHIFIYLSQKRRVGRGVGSSKGKTCGRGHKGQKSRSGGGVRPTFEGGQTPFFKTLPKRGFTNPNAMPMVPINIGTVQDYIDMGRLDATKEITLKSMVDAGMTKVNSIKYGIKLLAKGKDRVRTPMTIKVSRASAAAIFSVEEAGGEITTVHYNKLALRVLLRPQKFDIIPRQARPPPRLMEYYIDWNNRGYLSPQSEMRRVLKRKSQEENASDNIPEDLVTDNTEQK